MRGRCIYSEVSFAIEVPNSERVVAEIKPICSVPDLLESCYIRLLFLEVSLLCTVGDQPVLRLERPEKSDLHLKLALLGAEGRTR